MLTADLVNVRRRGGELRLVAFDEAAQGRAREIAAMLLEVTLAHVGRTREEVSAAVAAVDVGTREQKLKAGLQKLIEDGCEFDADETLDPEALRREVFARAAEVRAQLEPGPGRRFDREAILADVAQARGIAPEAIERALFADLRAAHVLRKMEARSAASLVLQYERAQAQAVLLRAVKVTVDVRCSSPAVLRALFRKLKFLRLLHVITPLESGFFRIVIDGPASLFESATKYGLQLALALPALEDCDEWKLEADVRWGKERKALQFRLAGGAQTSSSSPAALPDDVAALVRGFSALDTEWQVRESDAVLELPGIGLSIPDLVFERTTSQGTMRVYLEVMGYWSRAAVWKRVELVQRGLGERILFAVSSRLRVSEEVLDAELPGELYVYKATMSARTIADRLDRVASKPAPQTASRASAPGASRS